VAALALGGQMVSGDQHLVQPFPDGLLVAVVDGLGHGGEAATAAKLAIATLEVSAQHSVITLVRRCHDALTQTRGVVMSLASFNELDDTITWIGVGNVTGVLIRADANISPNQENVLLRGGVVGYQLPLLIAAVIPVMAGDTLIFATDGLNNNFTEGIFLGDPPQRLAARILAQHGKGTDDALVLVARWTGKKNTASLTQKTET